jgi:hypothetical protein
MAGCCECGDEPSGSCAMELVSYSISRFSLLNFRFIYFKCSLCNDACVSNSDYIALNESVVSEL